MLPAAISGRRQRPPHPRGGRVDRSSEGRDVVVVTKDLPLRLKASVVGLDADEYRNELATDSGWTGFVELDVCGLDDRRALRAQVVDLEEAPRPAVPHRRRAARRLAVARSRGCTPTSGCTSCAPTSELFDLRGRSAEQRLAVDLLADDSIGIVQPRRQRRHRQERARPRRRASRRCWSGARTSASSCSARSTRSAARTSATCPARRRRRWQPWAAAVTDALESIVGPGGDRGGARPRPARGPAAHPHPRPQPHRLVRGHRRGAEPRALRAAHRAVSGSGAAAGWCSPTTSPSATTCASVATTASVSVIETLKGHPLFAHVTLTRSERSPIAALVTQVLDT